MSRPHVIVLKFGGSVLRSEEDLPDAVHEIYRFVRAGRRVVAVVSALGDTTDALLARARALTADPDPHALAALLETGEATSAALLALALDRAGVPAAVLDPARLGLLVEGDPLDAQPKELDLPALLRVLDEHAVAVVPGFVGRLADGGPALLGRGGSDLTALFIARRLGASCRLLKDVDGLYERDPRTGTGTCRRFATIGWDAALALGGGIVQPKALEYAGARGFAFEVGALGTLAPTRVGPFAAAFHAERATALARPLRVALLGCGVVGLGVYRRLAAQPQRFDVTRVLVRRTELEREGGPPRERLTSEPAAALAEDPDVVIDALSDARLSRRLVLEALHRGIHVVTASKSVVAFEAEALARLAEEQGAALCYGATVGGGVPVIEAARRAAGEGAIASVEGVVNGTTNFVLDRLAAGTPFADAVREAQERGFAEADPRADLDGTDAARKLAILAREAFGVTLEPEAIERTGIDGLAPGWVRAQAKRGRVVRLVAHVTRNDGRVVASVRPVALRRTDALARVHGERNRFVIKSEDGATVVVHGRGAGRWPTTEAILADLSDVLELQHRTSSASSASLAVIGG